MPGGDAVLVQTHAWFEAAIPGWGWLALDPTNGQLVGERHVTIGHGRSYDDVQPQRGVFLGPADSEVQPAVEIRRVAGGELWRPTPGLHLDEPLAGGGVFPAQPVRRVARPAQTCRTSSSNSSSSSSGGPAPSSVAGTRARRRAHG